MLCSTLPRRYQSLFQFIERLFFFFLGLHAEGMMQLLNVMTARVFPTKLMVA